MAGTLLTRDPNLGGIAAGTACTTANVPASTVYAPSGGSATFFKDAANRMWYRLTNAATQPSIIRLNPDASKVQSARFRYCSGQASQSVTRNMFHGWSGGGTAIVIKLQRTAAGQIQVLGLGNVSLAVTTISGGMAVGADYEIVLDITVGSTTSNGVWSLKVCQPGTDTVITGGSAGGTTANLGTAALTNWDIGSNDGTSQVMDQRYTYVQLQSDRTSPLPVYSPPASAPAGNYDMVLLVGQSINAGAAIDWNATDDYYDTGVYQWSAGSIQPAAEVLWSADVNPNPYGMGFVNRFVRSYIAAGRLAAGRQLLIVNAARRGTGFTTPDGQGGALSWDSSAAASSNNLYTNAVSMYQAALAAAGSGSVPVAILADHGETDGINNNPPATFKAQLYAFIDAIRTAIGAPAVPYLNHQMRPDLLASQNKFALLDAAVAVASTDKTKVAQALSPVGTTYYANDSVHFTAAGVRIIGQRMFALLGAAAGSAVLNQNSELVSTGAKGGVGTAVLSQTSTSEAVSARLSLGTAAIDQASSVVSTGVKQSASTGAVDLVSEVVATGSKTAAGTGALDQPSVVVSTGAKTAVGVVSLDQTSALVVTGQKLTAGTGALTLTSDVASMGLRASSGTAQLDQASTLECTSGQVTYADLYQDDYGPGAAAGPGQVDQPSELLATGSKATNGTSIVNQATDIQVAGSKLGSGAATSNSASTLTSTGWKAGAGAGQISQGQVLTSSGARVTAGTGAGELNQASELTSTGTKAVTGTAALDQPAAIASSGVKAGSGAGAISQTSTVVVTGERLTDARTGSGSVSVASDVAGVGAKGAAGGGGALSSSNTSSTGIKLGIGNARLDQSIAIVVVDLRSSFGVGHVDQTSALGSAGTKMVGGLGAVVLTAVVLTGSGAKMLLAARDVDLVFELESGRYQLDLDGKAAYAFQMELT